MNLLRPGYLPDKDTTVTSDAAQPAPQQPAPDQDLRRLIPQDRVVRTRAFAALLRAIVQGDK